MTIKVSCDGTELSPELRVDKMRGPGTTARLTQDPGRLNVQRHRDRRREHQHRQRAISGDNGTSVTVPAGGTANRHITDTYTHATGSLEVNKLIAGPAAGDQGQVKISVSCGGAALADFVIPAGPTQPISKTYDDIPAGSTCTIDETVNGATSTVSVTTSEDTSRSRSPPARKPTRTSATPTTSCPGPWSFRRWSKAPVQVSKGRSRSPRRAY